MVRWLAVAGLALVAACAVGLAIGVDRLWWFAAAPLVALSVIGVYDLLQRSHSVLRNYPVIGHARFLLERIRPEIQQYFVERNTDGTPYDREIRDLVYDRAKGNHGEEPFGTQRDVNAVGYEFVAHSLRAKPKPDGVVPTVRLGGPECTKPYDIALLNISAMSFGSLSAQAVEALNGGAALGGFAHDTGEGSITIHHSKYGGDLIWEIGSAYFGCRTADGEFDPEPYVQRATLEQVKAVSLKLSQGAKPGLGGLLPGAKVNEEVSRARGVPIGTTIVSPPTHTAFDTPRGLIEFVARLRDLSGGKPVGFKLCIGSRREFLAICKAMVELDSTPDFIIVDGSEGGTGAGPVEFEDYVGMPLTEGLMFVHNALVGCGMRERVRIGASGKIASGIDIVKRICQGADFTLAARAMMFAVGCIQAQACHTNHCPVGVATQDPWRARALVVDDKRHRVHQYQEKTVNSAMQIVASMGLDSFGDLTPRKLFRRVDPQVTQTYYDLFQWLEPGELLIEPPEGWRRDWATASPQTFEPKL
ncbi:FMN-binding glutamate synthase family protein [Aeromicrobium sp. CTD01-1L150]|uniref:FMN-binding glutamate synthase family protein n=1 Tax=Aeromicrobium sp. CTD01-1L150 TaxID=3341830 RepID=UPI0035BF41AC